MSPTPPIAEPTHRRSLAANCGWSLVGTLGFSAAQLAWMVLIARLGSAEMLGQFAFAMAVSTPVMLLANSALRTVQASDARCGFCFQEYLAFRLASVAVAILCTGALSAVLASDTRNVLLAVTALKAWEALGDVIQGDLQRRERLDLIGISQLLKGVLSIVALAALLHITGSISTATWAAAMAFGMVVLAFDLPACVRVSDGQRPWHHRILPRWSKQRLLALLHLTFPLGITVMLGVLVINVPRYFLQYYAGEAALGVFAALSWVAIIGNVIAGSIAHAVLPRLSQLYAERDAAAFAIVMQRVLAIGALSGIGSVVVGLIFGKTALAFVFGPEYASESSALIVLLGAMTFSICICFLDHALYAARSFRVQVPINAISLLLMTIGCAFTVPQYGILGAAYVVLSVQLIQAMARFYLVWTMIRALAGSLVNKAPDAAGRMIARTESVSHA